MKRFKVKKRRKNYIKYYIFIIFISFIFSLILFNRKYEEDLVNLFLCSITNKFNESLKKEIININRPENIIFNSLNSRVVKENLSVFNVKEDNYNYENKNTDYVEDPNPVKVDKPIVYLYNTHQLEEYYGEVNNDYNIKPNVLIASYILKEKLNNSNISTIVEDTNIKKYLNKNKMKYYESYKASRYFLLKKKEKYDSLTYYIDIHRDSINHKKSTLKYNNKKYAKVTFVVGTDFKGYKDNLKNANKMSKIINNYVPNLSNGTLKKGGRGVNGIYNQDISRNVFLIEIGGVEQTLEEINNTLDIISKSINIYIKGY